MSIDVSERVSVVRPPQEPECWADEDTLELICRSVRDVTHDVKTFQFESPDGSPFWFEPGQFITLHASVGGVDLQRCYTVSSPPTRPHRLSITVKRVPGGPFSNWLHDNLAPGDRLAVAAPAGAFTLRSAGAEKYLFLSGGSGITPVMSMLRTLHDLGSDADVVFVHSARTPADIVYRRELDGIAALMPNVRVIHVCEDDSPAERWQGLRGRLTSQALLAVAPDLPERDTFTCGPAPYMAAVRSILEGIGYDMSRYHEESFDFSLAPRPEVDEVAAFEPGGDASAEAGVTYAVEFAESGRTIRCRPDEFVLDAALDAGLRLPSACGQGMCGTCKTSMLSGEVFMQHNGGIRPKEIAQNKILVCCSQPRSDLRIQS